MTPLHTLAIVLLLPLAGPPRDFRMFDGPRIPAEFNQRVADYVETHRRVAAGFENPSMCSDPEEMSRQAAALAAAIRLAQPLTEGSIFTPPVARAFRNLMAIEARRGDFDMAPAAIYRDEAAIELEVASGIPWHAGRALSPALAAKLPTLPEELEYRIIARHLVLVDVGANLVVDILRDAVPAGGHALPAPSLESIRMTSSCYVHPELPSCWI
jgi:hypothetical protein